MDTMNPQADDTAAMIDRTRERARMAATDALTAYGEAADVAAAFPDSEPVAQAAQDARLAATMAHELATQAGTTTDPADLLHVAEHAEREKLLAQHSAAVAVAYASGYQDAAAEPEPAPQLVNDAGAPMAPPAPEPEPEPEPERPDPWAALAAVDFSTVPSPLEQVLSADGITWEGAPATSTGPEGDLS